MMKLRHTLAALALAALPAAASEAWETDYDTALKKAAEGDKYLLMNFTGSDW